MRYDTVVFDLDGTLLATAKGIEASMKATFEARGVDYTGIDFATFVGPASYVRLRELFPHWEDSATVDFVHAYRRYFGGHGLYQYDHYEGIKELLVQLKARGKTLCVATNKPGPQAKEVLAHAGLDGFFTRIIGPDMASHADHKAECIRLAAQGLPGRAIMVGDRAGDIKGAKENGMDSVYVGYGYGSMQEMRGAMPTYYTAGVAELSRLLLLPGAFFTFEGGDGAGKTTQLNLLGDHLRQKGLEVVITREPGGCPIAEQVRHLLLSPQNAAMRPETEALLYAAARAQHVREVILPALERGAVVLSDRYYDSSVVYQAVGRGLGEEMIGQINAWAMDALVPQRTYLLYADMERTLSRKEGQLDRIEQADAQFKQRVTGGFLKLSQNEPQRVILLDAGCPIDELFAIIRSDADRLLGL